MDVMEAIRARRSVRAFADRPVSKQELARLFEAAAAAPSSHNSQPWRFHAATGRRRRSWVNEVISQSTVHLTEYLEVLAVDQRRAVEAFFADLGNAPVVIAVSLPAPTDELEEINEFISTGAAMQNMMLAATDLGLASCSITFSFWVRDQLREVFDVSEDRTIVALLLIGHSAEEPAAPPRREDIGTILE